MIRSRRAGFTLLEMLLALGLFVVLIAGAWFMFGGGVRSFYQGSSLNSAMQGALVFLDRIEHDLDRIMVTTGSAGTAVRISEDGTRMAFHIPASGSRETPIDQPVPGVPVYYTLTPVPGEQTFWPTRNGQPFRGVEVLGWSFHHERAPAPARGMQFLRVEVEAAGLFGKRSFPLSRRKELPAVAAAARYLDDYAFVDRWISLAPVDEEILEPDAEPGGPVD